MSRQHEPKAVPNYTNDNRISPDSRLRFGMVLFMPTSKPLQSAALTDFLRRRLLNSRPSHHYPSQPDRTKSHAQTLRSRWLRYGDAAWNRQPTRDVKRSKSSPVPAARSSQRASKSIFSFSFDAPSLSSGLTGPLPDIEILRVSTNPKKRFVDNALLQPGQQ